MCAVVISGAVRRLPDCPGGKGLIALWRGTVPAGLRNPPLVLQVYPTKRPCHKDKCLLQELFFFGALLLVCGKCLADRVGVQPRHVPRVGGIATAEGDDQGDAPAPRRRNHPPVPFPQALLGEAQAAEQVMAEGVDSGLVMQEVESPAAGKESGQGLVELGEVDAVADTGGKPCVEVARLLEEGEGVLLVEREGEDPGITMEDAGGAVALVQVAIDHHRRLDGAPVQENTEADGDVVEQAEAGGVSPVGMMEAAADVHADAASKGLLPRQDGAAGHQPEKLDDLMGQGDLRLVLFVLGKVEVVELLQVLGGMGAEDVGVGDLGGLDGTQVGEDALKPEGFEGQPVFGGMPGVMIDLYLVLG
ncbi:MAG: hypothetical protein OEL83_14530 [Desulforhopalus sp.]|nr:hypothetical protein [Desulforhopalus sp.]